jgi:DNA-binding IclR family transcriptional regulator
MIKAPKTNISKSVARAFGVLELFRQRREPLTAAMIRNDLAIPQPSVRALLKNLTELGYLSFDDQRKTYFPTLRLTTLGDWVSNKVLAGVDVARLVDAIAAETGETTSLNIIDDLNLEILYTKTAAHPLALTLRPGIGDLLWLSAAGRTLIGALPEDRREALLQAMIRKERNPNNRKRILALTPALRRIHGKGFFVGYDIYLQGVGAVCVRAELAGQNSVIAVAGAKDRIRSNEKRILKSIRHHLQIDHPR